MLNESTFPVIEVPAVGIPKDGKEIDATGYKFIVKEDTNEILSCMSTDYKLVSNQEVIDKAMPSIEKEGGKLTECKTFGNGARTSWTFKFTEHPVEIYGDILHPQLNIRNSYDGTSTVSILGGVFRLVCANGAIIGQIFEQYSERHSIWNPGISNGKITDMVENTITSMETVFTNEFPRLFRTKIKEKDIVKTIERIPSQYNEDAVNYITSHNIKNYWDLFNLCTWIFTHRANRDYETTHKIESEIYPFIKSMAGKA